MKKINEITKGKAKSMFSTENEDHLIMHFSDDTSAFDGKKREALLGKGAVNNPVSYTHLTLPTIYSV